LLPPSLIVFGVREYVPNVHLVTIEVNRRDQAKLIAAYVEHSEIVDQVCRGKSFSQFRKAIEIRRGHELVPAAKRLLTFRLSLPEQSQCFAGNDVHLLIDYSFRG
jgi:hypothetical protein